MKLLRISLLLSAFLISFTPSLPLADTASPRTPRGWKTYVDRVHGFAFAYPPIYKRIRRPDRENWPEQATAAAEGRWVGLQHQRSDARIDFILGDERFDLNSFVRNAPTGVEFPPSWVIEGDNLFYEYGAGGGGVEYPDQFFFNLKGKTLYIVFDGPYLNDKTPSDETKEIEDKMLASFRVF
jgi:hypothetical protein